jgi:hypothetical protein
MEPSLFADYLPSGIYFWRWFTDLPGHASLGQGRGVHSSPFILARPAYRFAYSRRGGAEAAPVHSAKFSGGASGEVLLWI